MRDFLDVQKTPVGLKADLPESRQVFEFLADAEVACVIDCGFGAQGAALLVILLDPGVLVIDVKRRDDAVGDHPGAEAAGRPAAGAPVENQLDLAGTAEVEILADHLFEEHAASYGPVQHLSERELRLED
jgi:hypothetical protein